MSATKAPAAAAGSTAFHSHGRRPAARRRNPARGDEPRPIDRSKIIATNSAVRLPIVSGAPVAGGLAGYFVNGTTTTVELRASAEQPRRGARAEGADTPVRPREHEREEPAEGDAHDGEARSAVRPCAA